MDDDGQASVCYVSLHTYSKKHSWCPTDSSTHIHKPSVIQLLTVSKAISQWVDAKSALCVCNVEVCVFVEVWCRGEVLAVSPFCDTAWSLYVAH